MERTTSHIFPTFFLQGNHAVDDLDNVGPLHHLINKLSGNKSSHVVSVRECEIGT